MRGTHMKTTLKTGLLAGAFLVAVSVAQAGTLTVTSPLEGSYLGSSNTLSFNITGARLKVNVTATVTGPGGVTKVQNDFNPDSDGKINASLALGFAQNSPQGDYTVSVVATEPGATYNATNLTVTVDTVAPKILTFSPLKGSFVKGDFWVRYTLQEVNLKTTNVTLGGQTVPNNAGTDTTIDVPIETAAIDRDGPLSVGLTATDLANNVLSDTINVTLDRNPPVATPQYPRSDTPVRPRTDLSILVDVTDQFANAVDVTGVDIIVTRLDGTFLARASRLSFRSVGGTTSRWTGRLRRKSVSLPPAYKLVISAIDRAGNVAARQEVTVRS